MAKRVYQVFETVSYLVQVDEDEMMEYRKDVLGSDEVSLDSVVQMAVENGDVEHDGNHYMACFIDGVDEVDAGTLGWES